MDNEKLMILKMLEERKITAEEASRLLENTRNVETETSYSKGGTTSSDSTAGSKPQPNAPKADSGSRYSSGPKDYKSEDRNSNRQQYNKTSSDSGAAGTSFEDFANDISKKFESFASDIEPKIQKFTDMVVEKTSSVADKVSKSIQSYSSTSSTSSTDYRAKEPTTRSTHGREQRNFELAVGASHNQLNLKGINGDILIKGYNGDKITAKIFYKAKSGAKEIEFLKLGSKYLLDYNEDEYEHVSIDAFIPESLFENIIIENINGRIDVSSLQSDYFVINATNERINLSNISANNIKIESANANLQLNNVRSNVGFIDNLNGPIEFNMLDVEKLVLNNFNSTITGTIEEYRTFNEYMWEIESSNGKVYLNLPNYRGLGYYVNARTSLSHVKVGLIGLGYLDNSESFIEARSIDFDSATTKVLLKVETSNAQIVIN